MSDTLEYVRRIHDGDREAVAEVGRHLERIAEIADAVAARLRSGGRWIYVGAGTSGRLCALDAAELPPTFGVEPDRVTAIVAGGERALARSIEEAEDDDTAALKALKRLRPGPGDVVVGVAASGTTPFVRTALEAARSRGALTVAIVCNPGTPVALAADLPLQLHTGPEVLAGSTRMKAGTAQKTILTMLSTAVMRSLGRVHRDEMVAMRPTNSKLRARARRILADLCGLEDSEAQHLLEECAHDLAIALLRARFDIDAREARRRLERHGGSVADALEEEG